MVYLSPILNDAVLARNHMMYTPSQEKRFLIPPSLLLRQVRNNGLYHVVIATENRQASINYKTALVLCGTVSLVRTEGFIFLIRQVG